MVNYNHPPKASRFFDGKLDKKMQEKKMQEDLKLAGFANRTVHGYLRAVRQLADFAQLSSQPTKPSPTSTAVNEMKN